MEIAARTIERAMLYLMQAKTLSNCSSSTDSPETTTTLVKYSVRLSERHLSFRQVSIRGELSGVRGKLSFATVAQPLDDARVALNDGGKL